MKKALCFGVLVLLAIGVSVRSQGTSTSYRSNLNRTGEFLYPPLESAPSVKWLLRTNGFVCSTPAISEGLAVFGCNDGYIYAVDISSGTRKWRFATGDRVVAPPEIINDTVLVGSEDGYFYALERSTGRLRWKFHTDERIWASSATIGNFTYFGSFDGFFYCLRFDSGTLVWKAAVDAGVSSTPVVTNGLVIASTSREPPYGGGGLHAFEASTGKERWRYPLQGGTEVGPVIWESAVFVAYTQEGVFSIDLSTRELRWKNQTPLYSYSSAPAVSKDLLIIPEQTGRILALNTATGRMKWSIRLEGVPTEPAVVSGNFYIGTDKGLLYRIDFEGKEKWRIKLESSIISGPVPYEQCIFVGTKNGVYALE